MRKNLLLAISCSLLISLAGCDFKDIDKRLFIIAIGVDEDAGDANNLTVCFKVAIPGGAGGGDSGSIEKGESDIYTITGNSISKIFRQLKSETAREPDFSHAKMIIFGKHYSDKHNIESAVDFFMRRRDVQNMSWIAIGMPSAKEILKVKQKEEIIPGNSLFLKFGGGAESPYKHEMRLYKFYNDTITPGLTPSCSVMEAEENKIKMNKTVLFSKGKSTLILNKDETFLFNLLRKKSQYGLLDINYFDPNKPLSIEEANKPLSIGIDKSKVKIKVDKNREAVLCSIKIMIEATLEEKGTYSGNPENLAPYFEKVMHNQITNLLNKLKKNNMDPLDLEMRYWSNNKSFMPTKEWSEKIFPNIKFVVDTKISILRSGVLQAD